MNRPDIRHWLHQDAVLGERLRNDLALQVGLLAFGLLLFFLVLAADLPYLFQLLGGTLGALAVGLSVLGALQSGR